MSLGIRKGDQVQIVAGSDSGKRGKVLAVRGRKLRIEGVRMQKRHLKAGRAGARSGGIVEQEGYIDASNAMLIDPASDKPSRVRVDQKDGVRARVFVRSGDAVPDPQT